MLRGATLGLVILLLQALGTGIRSSGEQLPGEWADDGGSAPNPAAATVDAGPDLFMTEGQGVLLQGTATPGLGWATLWTDSMDSYALGSPSPPWTDEAVPPSTAMVSNAAFHGPSGNSLRLYDPDTTSAALASRPIGYDRVDVRVWARASTTTGWATLILRSDSAWSAVRAGFGENGFFLYDACPLTSTDSTVAYVANTWYELRIRADAVAGTYDFYVNGTTIASGRPLCTPSTVFTDVAPCSGGSFISTSYWDDFSVDVPQLIPIVEYRWDFNAWEDADGDGNYTNDADALTPAATAVYGDNGDFLATLTVTDASAAQVNDSLQVTVSNELPQVTASVMSPASVTTGADLVIQVQDPGSDDLLLNWTWDDGGTGAVTYLNGAGPDPPVSPEGSFPALGSNTSHHDFATTGVHFATITVVDDDGGQTTTSVMVEIMDAPMTTLGIGSPNYSGTVLYINRSTPLTLTAMDQSTTGVNASYYRVDGGSASLYSAPFLVTTPGGHNLTFWSTDNLGGIEAPKSLEVFADNEPPTTTVTVTGASVQNGSDTWILPTSTLSFWSVDNGSGVSEVLTRVWNGSAWSSWTSAPATLAPPVASGPFAVEYFGIDRLGQPGTAVAASYVVDGAPPSTSLLRGTSTFGEWVTSSTPLSLASSDLGVGVDMVRYRVWSNIGWGSDTAYSAPFTIGGTDGLRYVEFQVSDLLGNLGSVRNETVRVDNTPPVSLLQAQDPQYSDWVTNASELVIVAADEGAGVRELQYRLWHAGIWSQWSVLASTASFLLSSRDGLYHVEFHAIDNLGNEEAVQNRSFRVDTEPPQLGFRVEYSDSDYEFTVTLDASDAGAGLAATRYRVGDGQWTDYSAPIVLRGKAPFDLEFMAVDHLGNTAVVDPPSLAPRYLNLKPLLSAVLALTLAIVGGLLVRRRDEKKQVLVVLAVFVATEVGIGVASYFTDVLRTPPWVGAGTIVNIALTVIGLVILASLTRRIRPGAQELPQEVGSGQMPPGSPPP